MQAKMACELLSSSPIAASPVIPPSRCYSPDSSLHPLDSTSPLYSSHSSLTTEEALSDTEVNKGRTGKKTKKRVTFPCQAELECVFEIPARSCLPEDDYGGVDDDDSSDEGESDDDDDDDDDGDDVSDACDGDDYAGSDSGRGSCARIKASKRTANKGVKQTNIIRGKPIISDRRDTVIKHLGTHPGAIGKTNEKRQASQSTLLCTLARKSHMKNKQVFVPRKPRLSNNHNSKAEEAVTEEQVPQTSQLVSKNARRKVTPPVKTTKRTRVMRPSSSPSVLRVKTTKLDLSASGSQLHGTPDLSKPVMPVHKPAVRPHSSIMARKAAAAAVAIPTFSALPNLYPSMAGRPRTLSASDALHCNNLSLKNAINARQASGTREEDNMKVLHTRPRTVSAEFARSYEIANLQAETTNVLNGYLTEADTNLYKLSPKSALPNQRKLAWQSANGLHNMHERHTPCISPMFEEKVTITEFTYM